MSILTGGRPSNIGQVADPVHSAITNSGGMQIQIRLDAVEPPAGAARNVPATDAASVVGSGVEIPFVGWLGLLRALSDLIASASSHPPGPG